MGRRMHHPRSNQNPSEHRTFPKLLRLGRESARSSGSWVEGARLGTGRPELERRTTVDQGPFFFCLKHHTVETRDGCAERHRLGPFATRAEAERALDKVAERNEAADASDRAWEGDR
jgi:hypothetical protein